MTVSITPTPRRRRRRGAATATATPTRERKLCLGYCRVSTHEQIEDGASLAAQEAKLRAYATDKGWDFELVAGDAGISAGTTTKRPALTAALARLAAGEADILLSVALDRLSRSVIDISDKLMSASIREGWELVCLRDSIDTSTAMGRAFVQIAAVFAELERGLIGERTKAGMAQKLIERQADDPTFRFGPPRRLALDEKVRARIVEERRLGLTTIEIAATLTAEGVPTARGGPTWHPAVVWSVAKNAEREGGAA